MDDFYANILQELRRGTLVLSVLMTTGEPVYGYSLVSILQDKGVIIEHNTLYPLLRRLEKQGLLSSQWDTAESRPRKYYQITDEGKKTASMIVNEWKTLNNVITNLINEEEIYEVS